jgi:hypothetical protein
MTVISVKQAKYEDAVVCNVYPLAVCLQFSVLGARLFLFLSKLIGSRVDGDCVAGMEER